MFRAVIRTSFVRQITSGSTSSTGDPNKTKIFFSLPPGSRKRRRDVRSKLRDVGRVHAPESDMRPLLPHRDLLLRSIQKGTRGQSSLHVNTDAEKQLQRKRNGLGKVADETWACAFHEDLAGLERIIQRTVNRPLSTKQVSRWYRVIVMNALHGGIHASWHSSSGSAVIDDILTVFTQHGIIDSLPPTDIGFVLDVLVRYKLKIGENSNAFRGELMSRALDTRLSSKAYISLIEKCDTIDNSLSLLHRAVAVGVVPTTNMLNHVLNICFVHDDGTKAKRVVAEMAQRELKPNRRTLQLLLDRADGIDGVDAVFDVIKRASDPPLKDTAELFLNAYIIAGMKNEEYDIENNDLQSDMTSKESEYIRRCFSVIDWFFNAEVGVGRKTMDNLVEHFARNDQIEAALTAWREMRRGWLGDPSTRSRAALYRSLASRGGERDESLQELLLVGLNEKEIEKIKRISLHEIDDEMQDKFILEQANVKEKATVLHRWMRIGRVEEVYKWIEGAVSKANGSGIDVRLLLPLLSDTSEFQHESFTLLLIHLTEGKSVAGEKKIVYNRVNRRLRKFITDRFKELQVSEIVENKEDEGEGNILNTGKDHKLMDDAIMNLIRGGNADQAINDAALKYGIDDLTAKMMKLWVTVLTDLNSIIRVCGEDSDNETQ